MPARRGGEAGGAQDRGPGAGRDWPKVYLAARGGPAARTATIAVPGGRLVLQRP